MNPSYFAHPEDESLERFLLRVSDCQEVELVETHILACEACIGRVKALGVEIAAIRRALGNTLELFSESNFRLEAIHKNV
jgi:hypothetical protein